MTKYINGWVVCKVLVFNNLQPVFRDDEGQMIFLTKEDAEREIKDAIDSTDEAIRHGDIDEDSMLTPEDYEIVPAIREGVEIRMYVAGRTYIMHVEDDDWKRIN